MVLTTEAEKGLAIVFAIICMASIVGAMCFMFVLGRKEGWKNGRIRGIKEGITDQQAKEMIEYEDAGLKLKMPAKDWYNPIKRCAGINSHAFMPVDTCLDGGSLVLKCMKCDAEIILDKSHPDYEKYNKIFVDKCKKELYKK